jgi:flavodoxin
MKSIIIVHSYHHGNTEKIAYAIAEELNADVLTVPDINAEKLHEYDLIGFGAGIDSGKHYKPMLDFAKQLPKASGSKAFIFSTVGVTGKNKIARDHETLRQILHKKGYDIVAEFGCKGYNTNSILKCFGGINKGRPNDDDLNNAAKFAIELSQQL